MPRTRRSILAGVTFIGFGVAFTLGATAYPLGTTARMGPGFFPLLLGIALAVLGVVILIRPAEEDEPILVPPSWRGLAFLIAALLVFGATIRGLGLIPTVFLTALLAAFASRETRPPVALALAVGLTAVSVVVFAIGLQVTVPLLGPWIPKL
jgi:hypothetical protein